MARQYIKTHKGIDILKDTETGYYFLHTEVFPFESVAEAVRWINWVTPTLIVKDRYSIEIDAGVSVQEHLGYQLN
jgi:NDP-sugar pyrophosphorylase family protein